jgi:2-polyprenyl-6-methoxyphenol hydroxylase-like FAD-dependent oxidoreductase
MGKKKIAIIGAGTAGMVQAMAFSKLLGDTVEVCIFEQHAYFDLSRGVELVIGPAFQIVMQALGHDMSVSLQQHGYPFTDASVTDQAGCSLPQVEAIIRETQTYRERCVTNQRGELIRFQPYNINRGIFMQLLQKELLSASQGRDITYWGYKLERVVSEGAGAQKDLYFTNGECLRGFDLVVGADGVHSKLRGLLFDQQPAAHVGANILYGVINGPIDIFQDNKFNIICGQHFTMVSCCYKDREGAANTWWAMVYPDQLMKTLGMQAGVGIGGPPKAFWESRSDVEGLARRLVDLDPGETYSKRYVQETNVFKYAGSFLERDPLTLTRWGSQSAVLIGDAAHAMQPWASVGASMAAEDAYVLASAIQRHGFEDLPGAFEDYQATRMNRVLYFWQMTRYNTPQGIMPTELRQSIETVIAQYGDQRSLMMCPAWDAMLMQRELRLLNAEQGAERTIDR